MGMIPVKYLADAIHVAVAVLGGADIVVSWLENIEILAPPEI